MSRTLKRCGASAMLSLLMLTGCASNSKPQPPAVAQGLKLPPQTVSVQQINTQSSETWQAKVSSYLLKVRRFSENATGTCIDC